MELIDENEVASVHRTRVEAMRREKERQQRIRRYIKKYAPVAVGILAALILVVTGIGAFIGRASDKRRSEEAGGSVAKLAAAFRNVSGNCGSRDSDGGRLKSGGKRGGGAQSL